MHLGISAYFHDSSVALLDDNGDLINFKKEEWVSRIKGDKSFPRLAIHDVLHTSKIEAGDIKSVTFYEKPMRAWLTVLKHSLVNYGKTNDLTVNYFKSFWKSSIIFKLDLDKFFDFENADILYADHHLSHTLSALYYADVGTYNSIVVDGFGDHTCTSIHHVRSDNNISELWHSRYPHSIGLFYSAITDFLGFTVNEGEYQVMGLAAYGEPKFYELLTETIAFSDGSLILFEKYFDFVHSLQNSYSKELVKLLGVPARSTNKSLDLDDPNFKIYADIAASAQKIVEDLLCEIFQKAWHLTDEKKFLFSGGVAMNSVAINVLSKCEFIDRLIVPPSPGDSGAAIGAALYGMLKHTPKENNCIDDRKPCKELFPGRIVQNDDFYELNFKKIAVGTEAITETSKLIAAGNIIATCYENIETGPRALGNRSLICNAHDKSLVETLNTRVKNRSKFRPTAPAVLEKHADTYFNLSEKIRDCYYFMGAVATPKPTLENTISGVVHVDGTCRVQLCKEEDLLGQLLLGLEWYDIHVLANTSFNIASDPMVYSKEDAFLATVRMGIDFLLTETGLYEREVSDETS